MGIDHLIRDGFAYGLSVDDVLLAIGVDQQRMYVITNGQLERTYPVSTSKYGLGSAEGSYKTPPGFHEISDRIGEGCEPGSVFKSRIFTGQVVPPERWNRNAKEDLILSRILRLKGVETGVNAGHGVDSYDRMIYIHGTSDEDAVGHRPSSIGCIRMKNHDIIELFAALKNQKVWCWIGEEFDPDQSS